MRRGEGPRGICLFGVIDIMSTRERGRRNWPPSDPELKRRDGNSVMPRRKRKSYSRELGLLMPRRRGLRFLCQS
jgi:hypothetical protein